MFGFKIIRQYERGVVLRWGRALPGIREPGLTWVNPFTDGCARSTCRSPWQLVLLQDHRRPAGRADTVIDRLQGRAIFLLGDELRRPPAASRRRTPSRRSSAAA